MKENATLSGAHPHLRAVGLAAGYMLILHLFMWLGVAAVFLWTPSSWIPYLIVPPAILSVGVIGFLIVRIFPEQKITFYSALLITHLLLSLLFLTLENPIFSALRGWRGTPDVANLDSLYFLYAWVVLAVGMGIVFFVLSIAFALYDVLREAMGYNPSHRKTSKTQPKGRAKR